jgi:hypothetical protein
MNSRRSSTKATIRLETLEDRITPVALDLSLVHLGATRAALLGHTETSHQTGSGPRLNLVFIHGHRQIPITATTNLNTPHHKTPKPIQPSVAAVSSVENPAPEPASVVSQPVRLSTGLPIVPPSSPVTLSPSPVVTPTVPIDPIGGTTTTPSNPPFGSPGGTTTTPAPATTPAALPANLSQPLQAIYQAFQAAGGKAPFTTSDAAILRIQGTSVGVQIHGKGGDFDTLVADMQKLGLQIDAMSATTQEIDGLLPIGALVQAALDPLTLSITPSYPPLWQTR